MSCRSNQAAAAAPKSRLLELRLLRGEGYSSAAQGRRGPQKEIKDRNVLENKYKAETRLKKWRISPCQSHVEGEGPLTEQKSIFLCAQGKPTFDLPVLDLYMYITHTHTQKINFCSTRPPHASLRHCAPQYNKPCLKCINLLTTMEMRTLRGIPALLTSCSWNIVFILTINWARIKYTARKRASNMLIFNCEWASTAGGEVDIRTLDQTLIRWILLASLSKRFWRHGGENKSCIWKMFEPPYCVLKGMASNRCSLHTGDRKMI